MPKFLKSIEKVDDLTVKITLTEPNAPMIANLGMDFASIVSKEYADQLAASGNFGQLLRRNYPVAIASRFGAEPEEEVTITGCLCTPLDLLADEAMLPRAEVGDLIAIFCAGAYGLSASPTAFLSQPMAREIFV